MLRPEREQFSRSNLGSFDGFFSLLSKNASLCKTRSSFFEAKVSIFSLRAKKSSMFFRYAVLSSRRHSINCIQNRIGCTRGERYSLVCLVVFLGQLLMREHHFLFVLPDSAPAHHHSLPPPPSTTG